MYFYLSPNPPKKDRSMTISQACLILDRYEHRNVADWALDATTNLVKSVKANAALTPFETIVVAAAYVFPTVLQLADSYPAGA